MNKEYKILVVDDSTDNRQAVADILREQGYTVEEVCSGKEALEKCKSFKAHLFLIDVIMPEMSGLDILRELCVKDNVYEAIIMTGYESLQDAKKSMELGAFSYISKPLMREELNDQVRRALSMVKLKQDRLEYLALLEAEVKGRTKKLEETVQILEDQGRSLDTIINNMPGGLIALDKDWNIVLINRQAEKVLQIQDKQCVGKKIRAAIRDKKIVDQLLPLVETEAQDYSERNNILIDSPKEGSQHFLVKVSDIKDKKGSNTGRIINLIDQTEKAKMEEFRSSFLSIVAHELRTPVNVFLNYLSVLQKPADRYSLISDIINDMKETGVGLKHLVNNIISVADLSGVSVIIEFKPTDINTIIEEQIEMFRFEMQYKKIKINKVNKLNGAFVVTDPKILGIATRCLISNAVKFNRENGEIKIEIALCKRNSTDLLLITVQDQGSGIPEEKRRYIFDNFIQGEDPLTRKHKGIGTGLYLVKRAVEILQGNIEIFSENTKGTRFVLEIPVEEE